MAWKEDGIDCRRVEFEMMGEGPGKKVGSWNIVSHCSSVSVSFQFLFQR